MGTEIFFVINSLQAGGAERVISTLATHFHERRYPVKIICLNYAESVFKLPDDLKIVYLVNRRSNNVISRIYYAVSIFIKLSYLLYKKKPKCVISFMTTANLWTGISCILTKRPFIVSERTTPDHTISNQNRFMKWCFATIYSKAKAIVLPAKGIENCLKENKGFEDLKNYRIINNPVTPLGLLTHQKVNSRKFILGVGRLSYEKGFDQLIAAFANLKAKELDILIAGEGIEFEALNEQINYLKLGDSIKLIGLKENLQDYYSQAELFVLPSRNEGYPNALVEAMSMGCPCIAMDCEFGPAEIINNQENGLLIEDKNIQKLTVAIDKVLKNPVLKNKIGSNARLINLTNSLDNISSQWENIIFSA